MGELGDWGLSESPSLVVIEGSIFFDSSSSLHSNTGWAMVGLVVVGGHSFRPIEALFSVVSKVMIEVAPRVVGLVSNCHINGFLLPILAGDIQNECWKGGVYSSRMQGLRPCPPTHSTYTQPLGGCLGCLLSIQSLACTICARGAHDHDPLWDGFQHFF